MNEKKDSRILNILFGTDIKRLKQLGARPFLVGLLAALSVGVVSVILIKILAVFMTAVK